MSDLKFNEGDEVAFYNDFNKFLGFKTVYKVYKSGNFILEQGGVQYRQDGHQAGKDVWRASMVTKVTPENRPQFEKILLDREAKKRVGTTLAAIQSLKKFTEAEADALEKIYAEMYDRRNEGDK